MDTKTHTHLINDINGGFYAFVVGHREHFGWGAGNNWNVNQTKRGKSEQFELTRCWRKRTNHTSKKLCSNKHLIIGNGMCRYRTLSLINIVLCPWGFVYCTFLLPLRFLSTIPLRKRFRWFWCGKWKLIPVVDKEKWCSGFDVVEVNICGMFRLNYSKNVIQLDLLLQLIPSTIFAVLFIRGFHLISTFTLAKYLHFCRFLFFSLDFHSISTRFDFQKKLLQYLRHPMCKSISISIGLFC